MIRFFPKQYFALTNLLYIIHYIARWVHVHGGNSVPFRAVVAGVDVDGATLYVGRAHHEGELLPAKVTHDRAYVPHGGREHMKFDYEVLCEGNHSWVPSGAGAPVPYNAVAAGNTGDGEPLYIGRGWHAGSQMPGKVHCSHGCLYVPFGGEEISVHEYEVLVEH